jgi:DNA-binding beta-propeller fold protein YncE
MRGAVLGWSMALLAVSLLIPAGRAAAEINVPPGFRVHVYVTGEGFDSSRERGARGIPSVSTLGFDPAGVLYLARTGRRYTTAGETDDTWPLYRVPLGGARLSAKTEPQYLYGPPLPNPQIGAVRGERELFVTTYDRDRKIGVLYRVVNGRAELFAGGTPDAGAAPLLKQPEGTAVDTSGGLYVADRMQGAVVKLDAAGRVLRERYVELTRPRVLVPDGAGGLWIGADGGAEAPWQQGEGEIWRISVDGVPRRMLLGPIPQAIAVSPGGNLLVADRHNGHVFALTPDGARVEFMRFADGDAPRSLAFAPVTPETERAGIAGQLFVVAIRSSTWPVNDVLRISGPIDDFVRERRGRPATP